MKKATRGLSLLLLIGLLTGCLSGCFGAKREVTGASVNEAGELVLSYSDGTTERLGGIVGQEGAGGGLPIAGGANDLAAAASKGLRSAVSVKADFTRSRPGATGKPGGAAYSAAGSGVIYRFTEDGGAFIITNYHVVYDPASDGEDGISRSITASLYGAGGAELEVSYVGGSMYYDIAVLRAEPCAALSEGAVAAATVAAADSAAAGSTAMAIGNPANGGISVSSGIVSVDSEYITMTAADGKTAVSLRVLRVDTAINSGNSGGGLFNARGELIGIVNAKLSSSSIENIGFAIPASVATAAADNIIDNCYGKDSDRVLRVVLGVSLETAAYTTVLDGESGLIRIAETVTVNAVTRGSAADGVLMPGDVILSAAVGERSVSVTRRHHVTDLLLDARVGDTVSLKLLRSGAEITVSVRVGEEHVVPY